MMIANTSRPNFAVSFHHASHTDVYPVDHPILWWAEDNGIPMFAIAESSFVLAGKPQTFRVLGDTYSLREDISDYLCKRRVYVRSRPTAA